MEGTLYYFILYYIFCMNGEMYLCIPLSMCTSCPAGDVDMQVGTLMKRCMYFLNKDPFLFKKNVTD